MSIGASRPIPTSLDGLLPHVGRSRLIRRVLEVGEAHIACEGTPPSDPEHPLRVDGTLEPSAAVEYGAQAMAIHGALAAGGSPPDAAPRVGYLVAVRDLRFGEIAFGTVATPVRVEAERVLAMGDQVSYAFVVSTPDGARLASGRASVALQGGSRR